MKRSLFPKKRALDVLTSKRQSLFKKRMASKIAKRDVSVFGGPGSGRYPKGSGENPQAEKRDLKRHLDSDAENLLERLTKTTDSIFVKTGVIDQARCQNLDSILEKNLAASQIFFDTVQERDSGSNDLEKVAEKHKDLLPDGLTTHDVSNYAGIRSLYYGNMYDKENARICLDAYFETRKNGDYTGDILSYMKESFPTDEGLFTEASGFATGKELYQEKETKDTYEKTQDFLNKLKDEDSSAYDTLNKKYDLSF